jgi:uncharacterized protein YgbK (DUF1537 family)
MGSRSRLVPRGGGEHLVTIIADDLSGATDSAVACAERGLDTVVALVDTSNNGRAEAIAFDADTRRRSRRAAAAETARLVRSHANMSSGILFKKIDSTLRGHIGAEIAALLSARRGHDPFGVEAANDCRFSSRLSGTGTHDIARPTAS